MSIATFIKVARVMPAWQSVMLRGPHGIGKSQMVRDLAEQRSKDIGKELVVIDRRLSQITEGDMVGLPSTDGHVTRFNPPDWYVECCNHARCLFLDELNRATPEVMQAAFQIVLDRELAGIKLHPETVVYAAINTGAAYTVNEVDPALLDRFFIADIVPDVSDWIKWANETKPGTNMSRVESLIVEFIRDNNRWLDTPHDAEPGAVTPSRRSWERLSNALREIGVVEEPDNDLFYSYSLGFVGTEAAIALRKFGMTFDRTVSAEDILNKFTTAGVKRKMFGSDGLRKPTQDELNGWVEKLSDHVMKNVSALTEKQGKNLQSFMEILPDELQLMFWTSSTKAGIEKLELTRSIHKYIGALVLKVFGVAPGEAGIGMVPKIPGMAKK